MWLRGTTIEFSPRRFNLLIAGAFLPFIPIFWLCYTAANGGWSWWEGPLVVALAVFVNACGFCLGTGVWWSRKRRVERLDFGDLSRCPQVVGKPVIRTTETSTTYVYQEERGNQ